MMNIGWVVTGMILLGTMTACAVSLYLKRRREQNYQTNTQDVFQIIDSNMNFNPMGIDKFKTNIFPESDS